MNSIRVVSLIEASSITGPAKPLIEFARRARHPLPGSDLPCADVSMISFHRGKSGSTNQFIDTVRQAGLHVDVIYEQRAFQLSILRELQSFINARRPHIIETNAVKSHFLIRLLGLYKRYRWVACHHGYVSTNLKVLAYNQLDRWSLPAVHHMFTVCEPFSRELQEIGVPGNRITVRHNMIELYVPPPAEDILALRQRLDIGDDTKIIFTGGRLSREKGHLDLVETAGKLAQYSDLPRYRIIIAGEGPEREAIERRCAELNLGKALQLVGHQSSLHPWYALADISVLPSHSEGSPMVLLEAMAAGLPVVATAVGGIPEIAMDGRNALLVPRGSHERMAQALADLLRDRELRTTIAAAAKEVTRIYTPDAYCRSTLNIYRNVLTSDNTVEIRL